MVPLAPRYDPAIFELVRRLDDPREPIAEVVRRVAAGAQLLGLFRPSYSHLRRYVHDERERQAAEAARRAAVRDIVADVAVTVLSGRVVNPFVLEDRLIEAQRGHPRRAG